MMKGFGTLTICICVDGVVVKAVVVVTVGGVVVVVVVVVVGVGGVHGCGGQ